MSNLKPQTSNFNRGFTLLEFLIVVALIGILATLTVLAMQNARRETRDAERVSIASQLRTSLALGFTELANYPTQEEGDLRLGGAGARLLCEASGEAKFVDAAGECAGTVFTPGGIPLAPSPADGDCTPAQNSYRYMAGSGSTNFNIEFCLGKAAPQSGLQDGLNCVTPDGLKPGSCPVSQ